MKKIKDVLFIAVVLIVIAILIAILQTIICAGKTFNENTFIKIQTLLYFITASAAVCAVIVSLIMSNRQQNLMKQEWLPYLSYEKMHARMIKGIKGIAPAFCIILKNNGRCIVNYKITQFDVKLKIGYIEKPKLINTNKIKKCEIHKVDLGFKQAVLSPYSIRKEDFIEGVLGINATIAQACGAYQFLFEERNKIKKGSEIYQFEIDFVVECGKIQETNKKYKLKYKINLFYDNDNDNFSENIITTEIVGY